MSLFSRTCFCWLNEWSIKEGNFDSEIYTLYLNIHAQNIRFEMVIFHKTFLNFGIFPHKNSYFNGYNRRRENMLVRVDETPGLNVNEKDDFVGHFALPLFYKKDLYKMRRRR